MSYFDQPKGTEVHASTPVSILKPALLLGMGRSGTTLLMQLLSTSPQMVFDRIYPYESRHLTYLLKWLSLPGQKSAEGNAWDTSDTRAWPNGRCGPTPFGTSNLWDTTKISQMCFNAAWLEFSSISANRIDANGNPPQRYYAEKIPFWVPDMLRPFFDFNLILLVRDPRDVFLSISAFDKKRGFCGFNRKPDDSDWAFATRFAKQRLERFRIMRAQERHPNTILVKYENLAKDLAIEARRLGEWLDVKLSAQAVIDSASNFSHHMTSNSAEQSVFRWREELSPELNAFFIQELGEELEHYGYDTSTYKQDHSELALAANGLSNVVHAGG